jgi:Zn-dependent protease with chaperone function
MSISLWFARQHVLLVKGVARRLIDANQLPDRDWRVFVIEDSTPNAFVTPGGMICVFSGLFNVLENEQQVAAVISHELGHAVARHTHEHLVTSLIMLEIEIFLNLLGIPISMTSLAKVLAPDNLRFDLHHSRTLESEADLIGYDFAQT